MEELVVEVRLSGEALERFLELRDEFLGIPDGEILERLVLEWQDNMRRIVELEMRLGASETTD
ncbi:MAG: hypothetical protein HY555_01240 [Euryarchaeota archaeon]|nr:hypothetical protein [Euryarchaeota archaeon]